MACSKKTVVTVLVLLPLLTPLLAAPASAAGGLHLLDADQQLCGPVKACDESQCSATCAVRGINGVGQCSVVGGVPTCCCVPAKPSAARFVGKQYQRALHWSDGSVVACAAASCLYA